MSTKQAILADLKSLPTIPTTLAQLVLKVQAEHGTADAIAEVIRLDPALTANFLKIANSAAFSLPTRVNSVAHCVSLLGRSRTVDIATSVLCTRIAPAWLPGYRVSAADFWRHCVGVAVISGEIGKQTGAEESDLCFTAGLLHDIGKLAVGSHLESLSPDLVEVLRSSATSLVEVERTLIEVDHAEVGGALSELWRLPSYIGVAARWHHDPTAACGESDRRLAALVHCADGLAHSLGLGADVGELAREIDGAAIEALGVRSAVLEEVAARSVDSIEEVTVLMVSGGAPHRPRRSLE